MTVIAILGSAPCAIFDLTTPWGMCDEMPQLCALNRMVDVPIEYQYFLTGHPEAFAAGVRKRKERGDVFHAIGAERHDDYDTHFRPHKERAYGGSVANAICYFGPSRTRIVLCGCPFDASGHFDDASLTYHAGELWDWFLRGHPHRAGYNVNVHSMSGQTRDLFGYPTKEWLNEPCQ
jgi:hypothetical protein